MLAFMLLILVAAAYALLVRLNDPGNRFARSYSSMAALQQAKAALIGYAVSYPDTHPNAGPGFLPCPDRNNDGATDGGGCALAPNATTIGRLPYKTLEIGEALDYSGEALWYALADNYRNNPQRAQLNSDVRGNFSVDGADDVVAIIFAPGPALAAQSRGSTVERLDVANYLEDDNANNDLHFVTQSAAVQDAEYREKFNDQLVSISRQELMQAVEKRVLGELARALEDYQSEHAAWPWLSPFADPSRSMFRGRPGVRRGHLAYHYSGDAADAGASGRNRFSTHVAVSWHDLSAAAVSVENKGERFGISTLSADCLNDIDDCDEGGIFPEMSALSPSEKIDCTWSGRDTADCESFSLRVGPVAYQSGTCPPGTLTRTYTIKLPAFTGSAAINMPSASAVRTRDVSLTAAAPDYLPMQAAAIKISDHYVGPVYASSGCSAEPYSLINRGSTAFDADTEGTIAIDNIHYDLDVDNDELPAWFIDNGWQALLYIAYADAEALPGDTRAGQDCAALGKDKGEDACLTVQVNGMPKVNVRAVAINAGVDLTMARPTAVISDYFEGDNSNLDSTFEKKRARPDYNDQTRIIATAP